MKYSGVWIKAGMEKLIQIAPSMTRISRMGIATDWNVNSRTIRTISTETTLTTMLSMANDFCKSYSLVASPAR